MNANRIVTLGVIRVMALLIGVSAHAENTCVYPDKREEGSLAAHEDCGRIVGDNIQLGKIHQDNVVFDEKGLACIIFSMRDAFYLDKKGASHRVLFFDSATNSFQIHWVSATSTTPQWLRDDDTSARLISPQDGLFVQIRSTPATLTFLGTVRSTALALPQSAGTRFIGTGLATPLAPGAQPFTSGSRLRLWNGDTDPAAANYQNFLLNPQSQWIDEATGLDVTSQPLLDAFRAYFWVK